MPDDGEDPFGRWSDRARLTGADVVQEWIAVLEFAPAEPGRGFLLADVQTLIGHLREWHATALWSPDRYAIQLNIRSHLPHQALQWAIAYHREAARASRLPPTTFVRVEILTVEEFERSWQEYDPTSSPAAPAAPQGLLCDELYAATRRLLAATRPQELTDIVIGFVTAMGGRVELGPVRHLPGTIDVNLSLEGDHIWHASAEAFSVAGLLVEQCLPGLVADARQALARLQGNHLQGSPPAGTHLAQ